MDAREWYLRNVLSEEPYFVVSTDNQYARNLNRIHIIKQGIVESICKEACKYTDIVDIVVFGSSTNFRCNFESDLDICIDIPDINHPIVKFINNICESNCDIIVNKTITSPSLAYEISRGVKVFERR